ncbi:lactonase family protein [Chloroflexi bacterium TSY]|nr:lactonase family protein [Chloroflexi bacterium TSY]
MKNLYPTFAATVYLYDLDPASGALEFVNVTKDVDNPSFLALSPDQRFLYVANEVEDYGGESSGAISAFAINRGTGELAFLNQRASRGAAPCHLVVDATGHSVLAANYTGGSVIVFPIQDDGSLGEASDFIQHEGSSVNPDRQEGAHAHSFTIDAQNRFAYAADLGMDKVVIYALDAAAGTITPNTAQPSVSVAPGAGPRHFDFHPNGQYAYVINELGSTVTAFTYDPNEGTLNEIQTISTLPADFTGSSHTADVHVHSSGKFLYGSNRGHDSIAIFSIDADTGKLTAKGHESTQGQTPRNFNLDPTGKILLAANQNTDSVVTFWIDQGTGDLTPTGHKADVPKLVCLKFLVGFGK